MTVHIFFVAKDGKAGDEGKLLLRALPAEDYGNTAITV
jgi:hypothetical protein